MQRVLREMSEAIGLGDTIELVRRWGGREMYVPTKVASGDPLSLSIGLVAAERLVKAFGGQRLQLPAERNALLDLRNAEIMNARKAGESMESIGLRYGLTRQAVGHIVKAITEREELRQKFAAKVTTDQTAQSAAS